MSRKSFNKLEREVEEEYRHKAGYTKAEAAYIGRATAGKIAREKAAKKAVKKGKTTKRKPAKKTGARTSRRK